LTKVDHKDNTNVFMKTHSYSQPSDAALLLLKSTRELDPELIVVEQLPRMRVATRNTYQPAIDEYQQRYCESVQKQIIGGVECLVITPKRLDATLQTKAMLYFYGGGYILGSPEEDIVITGPLADKLGIKVVCPRYALAPEHPWPVAHRQGIAAYRAMAKQYGADQLLVAGESAGGNMAISTLLRAHQEGLAMPAAVALLSPWCDLSVNAYVADELFADDPFLSPQYIDVATPTYVNGADATEPFISPVYADFGSWFPPTMMNTGSNDCLQYQVKQLAVRMAAAGVDVCLEDWAELWHVFEFSPEIPEADMSLTNISEFLRSYI
jgi:epsilon-lactone hydrolase